MNSKRGHYRRLAIVSVATGLFVAVSACQKTSEPEMFAQKAKTGKPGITLVWDKNPRATGYHVYRREEKDCQFTESKWELISGEAALKDTTYFDPVDTKTKDGYTYAIVDIDKKGEFGSYWTIGTVCLGKDVSVYADPKHPIKIQQ